MEELLGDIWPVLAVLAIVGVLGWAWWSGKKQREKIRSAAEAKGWSYRASDHSLPHRYEGKPFRWSRERPVARTGRHRVDPRPRAMHVLEGEHRGHRMLAFELRHRIERTSKTRTKSSSGSRDRRDRATVTEKHQIVALQPHRPLPPFFLERRGTLGRAAQAMGVRFSELGDPEFDSAFAVGGVDPEQARAILPEDVRAWLLQDGGARRRPVRVEGGEILTWRGNGLDVSRVVQDADFLAELLARIDAVDPRG